jgi:integrase
MAEIKMRPAVYANHKRKDGSCPVKIVVYYKGKERKMATHIVAEAKDLTRTFHLKQGEALSAAQDLIIDMRAACRDIPYFDLEYQDVDFVVNHIKGKLAKRSFRLDFFQFAREYLLTKKEGTRAQYVQALNAFARFLKKEEIDVNQITRTMVGEFIAFMDGEKKLHYNYAKKERTETKKEKAKGGQAGRHIVKLAAIYKAAKNKYNDEDIDQVLIPRSPFDGHKVALPAAQGQRALPKEVIQRMIQTQTENAQVRGSIDVAVVSFALMGMNLADLYEAKIPKDGVLVYNRKKTRDRRADMAEMRIDVPECILPFVERLQSARTKGVWLGKLHELTNRADRISYVVNGGLAKWCENEGIERFTFYALRKSWGTIARRIGVEKSLVDEGLVHVGDYRMTDIYAERPWEQINEANRKVLELFQWD